jgi:hypothetical protein
MVRVMNHLLNEIQIIIVKPFYKHVPMKRNHGDNRYQSLFEARQIDVSQKITLTNRE